MNELACVSTRVQRTSHRRSSQRPGLLSRSCWFKRGYGRPGQSGQGEVSRALLSSTVLVSCRSDGFCPLCLHSCQYLMALASPSEAYAVDIFPLLDLDSGLEIVSDVPWCLCLFP